MYSYRKLLVIALFLTCGLAVRAQDAKVCISQAAANKAAENARVIPTLESKIATLEDALKQKDTSITELKDANRQNVADLTERLHKTEVELATKTGQLIATEANQTRQLAIIELLTKKVGKRCSPLSILCL